MTEWQDIITAPEKGVFLVYLVRPMMGSRVHVMQRKENVTTIATVFHFDAPMATHWMPLPSPPTSGDE